MNKLIIILIMIFTLFNPANSYQNNSVYDFNFKSLDGGLIQMKE